MPAVPVLPPPGLAGGAVRGGAGGRGGACGRGGASAADGPGVGELSGRVAVSVQVGGIGTSGEGEEPPGLGVRGPGWVPAAPRPPSPDPCGPSWLPGPGARGGVHRPQTDSGGDGHPDPGGPPDPDRDTGHPLPHPRRKALPDPGLFIGYILHSGCVLPRVHEGPPASPGPTRRCTPGSGGTAVWTHTAGRSVSGLRRADPGLRRT